MIEARLKSPTITESLQKTLSPDRDNTLKGYVLVPPPDDSDLVQPPLTEAEMIKIFIYTNRGGNEFEFILPQTQPLQQYPHRIQIQILLFVAYASITFSN